MKIKNTLPAMLAGFILAGSAAHATVFDFSWDPDSDPNLVAASQSGVFARGTIEIDAADGAEFTLADLIAASITVNDAGGALYTFSTNGITVLEGTIAGDGSGASLSDFFINQFITTDLGGVSVSQLTTLGCVSALCINSQLQSGPFTSAGLYQFTSAASALASFELTSDTTVAPIPLPATALLLLGAVGLLAAPGLRHKRAG